MNQLPYPLRILIVTSTAVAVGVLTAAIFRTPTPLIAPGNLGALVAVFVIQQISMRVRLSMDGLAETPTTASETVAMAVLGPWWCLWIALLSTVQDGWVNRSHYKWYQWLFNAAHPVIAIAAGGEVYRLLIGSPAQFNIRSPWHLLAIGIVMLVNFGVSAAFTVAAVSQARHRPYRAVLRQLVSGGHLYTLELIPLGLTMAVVIHISPWFALLFAVQPLMAQKAAALQNRLANEAQASIESMARLVDERDHYTSEHSQRVASYAAMIGRKLGLSEKQLANLRRGCLVHDVGKVVLPDEILKGEQRLVPQQWAAVKGHVSVGYDLVKGLSAYQECADIVRYHHERYDGTGYPSGLKGEEIPLLARVAAIADAFDAMTSRRSYRPALSYAVAIAEIEQHAGSQFDPELARVAVAAFGELQAEESIRMQREG